MTCNNCGLLLFQKGDFMKTMLTIITIGLLSLGISSMSDLPQNTLSFGAPVSSTGAPDERTCATVGCHDTYAPNIGHGSMNITVEGAEGGFEPGKTYDVTVRVADKDSRRFGFQLVALNDDDKSNAGTITITDPTRTQIMTNDLQFQDRQYATYTKAGTDQFTDGVGYWKIKWTAPASAKNITLYSATVIANNDDTDFGDYVLTSSLPLSPKSSNSVTEHQAQPTWFAIPVIKGNNLICTYTLDKPDEISLELCDLSGKVLSLGKRNFGAGNSTSEYMLAGFPAGGYIVRASSNAGVFSYTIIIR